MNVHNQNSLNIQWGHKESRQVKYVSTNSRKLKSHIYTLICGEIFFYVDH